MTTSAAIADVPNKSVTLESTTYTIQELGQDNFTVLVKGVLVGRIVYTFGSANGVPEGDTTTQEALDAIAEAWFVLRLELVLGRARVVRLRCWAGGTPWRRPWPSAAPEPGLEARAKRTYPQPVPALPPVGSWATRRLAVPWRAVTCACRSSSVAGGGSSGFVHEKLRVPLPRRAPRRCRGCSARRRPWRGASSAC